MVALVVGASGATGRLLVKQLLDRGHHVRAIVRSPESFPKHLFEAPNLTVIKASLLDLSDAEIAIYVEGCDAVASCLGHNLTWRGIFGHPRRLVTEAVRRLCLAIKSNESKNLTQFILMNTAGNSNRDLHEPMSIAQRCILWLVRLLLPPHVDNEQAADYLRVTIGQNDQAIEWAIVRPDSLTNHDMVSEYEVLPSPTRSAIFNAGKTSRINVSHFMAELITNSHTWNRWKGQMPVVYNKN